jgi:AcrR family transcriptional regulator
MARARTPRDSWIEAAMSALAAGGPEAVRVEVLAKQLGVSKGGFYWHFDDRGALLSETLDSWEKAGTEDVIATVEGSAGDPGAKLRRLFELAPAAKRLFAVELALRDWGRRERSVAARVRRVDERRIAYLRSIFTDLGLGDDEVEARALLAYSLFVGSYFVAAKPQGRSRGEALGLAVDSLLAADPSSGRLSTPEGE